VIGFYSLNDVAVFIISFEKVAKYLCFYQASMGCAGDVGEQRFHRRNEYSNRCRRCAFCLEKDFVGRRALSKISWRTSIVQ
jgi:hypothetical protein